MDGKRGSRDCTGIPMLDYYGSQTKNIFHTQLMIGVMFGFMMKSRLPVLFSFLNIVIRSVGSFKPKSIPMCIDRIEIRAKNAYGSAYNLLNDDELLFGFEDGEAISSSDEGSDDDVDTYNAIPTKLFGQMY